MTAYFNQIIKFLFISLLLSISCQLSAQNIDSLKKALTQTKNDTIKCYLLNVLAENAPDGEWEAFNEELKQLSEQNLKKVTSPSLIKLYKKYYSGAINNIGYTYSLKGDFTNAINYYNQSLKLSQEIGDMIGVSHSYVNIGYIYASKGDVETSLSYFLKGLKIQETLGDKKGLGIALNNVGSIYDNQGDIPKALQYYHRSLKLREQIGDKDGIANSYNNLGRLLENQGDVNQALNYFEKSLAIRKEIGDKAGIAIMINNIGDIYETKGDTTKALSHYQKCLTLCSEIGYKVGEAGALNNIGYILKSQNQLSQALPYFMRSIEVNKSISNTSGLASCYNNIGDIYFKLHDLKEAEKYAGLGYTLSQQIGYPQFIKMAAKLLSNIYRSQKRYEESFNMYEIYEQMRDSVSNIENKKNSLQKQFQYEYDKKVVADSIKTVEEKKVVSIQLNNEKQQRMGLYVGLLIVIVFAGFMYNRFKITQKQKNLIEIKESETQYQKQLVEVKAAELSARQKEILDSITYAKRLQHAILPPQDYIDKHLPHNFVLYKPKDIVAGDFYWMEVVDGFVFMAAADSTGHGVPGAMVSVVCSNALNRSIKEFGLRKTGEVLDKTRELVLETFAKSDKDIKDGMDISLLCINKAQQLIMWSGANNSLCYKETPLDTELLEIKADKQPIGKTDNPLPFKTHIINYQSNLIFYLLTDGFSDQFGGDKGKKILYKNFKKILNSISELPLAEQKNKLETFFENWQGTHEQVDDVSIVAIKI